VQHSRALFWSPDRQVRVCCAVSKRYEDKGNHQPYWYSYHQRWDRFLAEGQEGVLILSCTDRDNAFALPHSWVNENKKYLNMTERGDKSYWYISLAKLEDGTLALNLPKAGRKAALEPYRFQSK
jgi:hypothetical protein